MSIAIDDPGIQSLDLKARRRPSVSNSAVHSGDNAGTTRPLSIRRLSKGPSMRAMELWIQVWPLTQDRRLGCRSVEMWW